MNTAIAFVGFPLRVSFLGFAVLVTLSTCADGQGQAKSTKGEGDPKSSPRQLPDPLSLLDRNFQTLANRLHKDLLFDETDTVFMKNVVASGKPSKTDPKVLEVLVIPYTEVVTKKRLPSGEQGSTYTYVPGKEAAPVPVKQVIEAYILMHSLGDIDQMYPNVPLQKNTPKDYYLTKLALNEVLYGKEYWKKDPGNNPTQNWQIVPADESAMTKASEDKVIAASYIAMGYKKQRDIEKAQLRQAAPKQQAPSKR